VGADPETAYLLIGAADDLIPDLDQAFGVQK
jgi:hypothetical protein